MGKGAAQLLALAVVSLIPPIAIGLVLLLTPNLATRIGDAGTFESANATPGSFTALPMTIVQTSRGTLVVTGVLSAMRGQPLTVQEWTKDGLMVCTNTSVCLPLAGGYAGQMHPTRHSGWVIGSASREVWGAVALFWFVVGMFVVLGALAFAQSELERQRGEPSRTEAFPEVGSRKNPVIPWLD